MMRLRAGRLPVAVALLAVTLAGCSDDADEASGPSEPPTSTGSPTATPTVPTGEPTEVPELPEEGRSLRGLNPATTEEEAAVADRWFEYREELNRMYREVTVDPAALGALATGKAYESPVAYVDRMKKAGTHNEGGNIASITELTVTGDRAVVKGCLRTTMVEKTAEGAPVETPEVWVAVKDTLRREGPDWRVERHELVSSRVPCTYR